MKRPLLLGVILALITAQISVVSPGTTLTSARTVGDLSGEPDDFPAEHWFIQRIGTPTSRFQFVDASHGWATSRDVTGGVFHTDDGGAHWDLVQLGSYWQPHWIGDLFFLDNEHGWVTGYWENYDIRPGRAFVMFSDDGWIRYTTDGGDTWSTRQIPEKLHLLAVHAVAAGLAWFAGENGLIMMFSAEDPSACWTTPDLRSLYLPQVERR